MPKHIHLLIIDENHQYYTAFRDRYESAYVFEYAGHYERGLDLIKKGKYDAVLLSLEFRTQNYEHGLKEILPKAIRFSNGRFPILVVSADARPDTLSKALKADAPLLLVKSEYDVEKWDAEIRRAIRKFSDPSARLPLQQPLSETFDGFVSTSPEMEEIKQRLRNLVNYPHIPVLIEGENGVGKEVAARYLHSAKNNPKLPFKVVNLAALSKDLIASELFGYVKGAFSGADKDKIGYFESAANGTLLLDEIGEIGPELQVQLLTALGNRSFQRVGSTEEIKLNTQLVFATNADLEKAVQEGRMRTDFYARISNYSIRIPPLYKRPDEIIPLINYFLPQAFSHSTHPFYGKIPMDCFTPQALQILLNYDWPRNIRQLKGLIENLVIESDLRGRNIIDIDLIPQQFKFPGRTRYHTTSNDLLKKEDNEPAVPDTSWNGWPPKKIKFYVELQQIERALNESFGRKNEAAQLLQMKNEQNMRSRIMACKDKFPEIFDSFPKLKKAYKI